MVMHSSDEEMQVMIPSQTKQTASRWPRFGLAAAAILGIAGVGLSYMGALQRELRPSVLEHVSMAHRAINSIILASVAKGDFNSKFQFLVDDEKKKDSLPSAMSIHSEMKLGDEDSKDPWPKMVLTLAALDGKGADLKEKLDGAFDAILDLTTKGNHKADKIKAQAKKHITITRDGDSVDIKAVPPTSFNKEDERLKAAFKQHKPRFHGDIAIARTFEEMYSNPTSNIVTDVRGIEAKLDAVFANSIFEVLRGKLPGHLASLLEVIKLFKVREELYYSSEKGELRGLESIPSLKRIFGRMCHSFPAEVASKFAGMKKVLKGLKRGVVKGLPYNWEVLIDFDKVNPASFLEHCSLTS